MGSLPRIFLLRLTQRAGYLPKLTGMGSLPRVYLPWVKLAFPSSVIVSFGQKQNIRIQDVKVKAHRNSMI